MNKIIMSSMTMTTMIKIMTDMSNRNGHRDHTDDESNNIVHDNITFGIQKGAE